MSEQFRAIAKEAAADEVDDFSIRVLGYDRADHTQSKPKPHEILTWAADQREKEAQAQARSRGRRETRQKTLGTVALMAVSSALGLAITSMWPKILSAIGLPIP